MLRYGLGAFNSTLQLLFIFLEPAVSPVVVLEFGRMNGKKQHFVAMRNLLRSLEVVSCITAVCIGFCVYIASPFVAEYWLRTDGLSQKEITLAVRLIGINLALQWHAMLYGSCLSAARHGL